MNAFPIVLLLWSAGWGPMPEPTLADAGPASSHLLTIVVCEEGPGDGCRALKKISQATVIIDDRDAGRTNDDGSLTTRVQRGLRTVHIAAVGYAGVEIRIDVRSDAQCDVELKPMSPSLSRSTQKTVSCVNDAIDR